MRPSAELTSGRNRVGDDETQAAVDVDDIPRLLYEEFVQALYVIRAQHDPVDDWEGFVEALWPQMVALFDAFEAAGVPRIPPDMDVSQLAPPEGWVRESGGVDPDGVGP